MRNCIHSLELTGERDLWILGWVAVGGVIVRCCCNAGSTGSTLGAGLTTLADDSGMWSSSNGLYLGSRQKMKVTLSIHYLINTLPYQYIILSIHSLIYTLFYQYITNTLSYLYIILYIQDLIDTLPYQYIILYIQDFINTLPYQYIILYIQDFINTLPYLYITLYIQYLIHILPYLYITQEYISLNNKLRSIANFVKQIQYGSNRPHRNPHNIKNHLLPIQTSSRGLGIDRQSTRLDTVRP